jgi:hypothetical protein
VDVGVDGRMLAGVIPWRHDANSRDCGEASGDAHRAVQLRRCAEVSLALTPARVCVRAAGRSIPWMALRDALQVR